MEIKFKHKVYQFKNPAGTSRGVLTEKNSWQVRIYWNNSMGLGECSVLPGLSPEFIDEDDFEERLDKAEKVLLKESNLEEKVKALKRKEPCWSAEWNHFFSHHPAIAMGVEMALLDAINGGKQVYFDSAFTRGDISIPINGLIWMADKSDMLAQVDQKLVEGYDCIKMKIGAIQQEDEWEVLEYIRKVFPKETVVRLDANGAFDEQTAMDYFLSLEKWNIHSVEQPFPRGEWHDLDLLRKYSNIPFALDEELIGVGKLSDKRALLDALKPPFIVLKPSLHGGISGCVEWINAANERKVGWWMTSALESNVGLNAIAQFTAEWNNPVHHGLGTGSLFVQNEPSSLQIEKGRMRHIN